MVKAGIFVLALLLPVLGGTPEWTWTLISAGALTLFTGAVFGLQQNDMKKLLAGTTLSVLGVLTLLLGIGTEKAVLAMLLFLIGHALYKATLFMVAGSVDHGTGTRDLTQLGGLWRAMPWTALAGGLAAISKMGLPLAFGFLGKEYTYKASLDGDAYVLVTSVLVVGNALLLALAVKAGFFPFWRRADPALPKHPHESPQSMLLGPLLLSFLGIVFGVMPGLLDPVLTAVKTTLLSEPPKSAVHLKLWHGLNLPLLLSGVTVALGALMVLGHKPLGKLCQRLPILSGQKGYEGALAGLLKFAVLQTRALQSGYLRQYLQVILLATLGLVACNWVRFGLPALIQLELEYSIPALVISLMMVVAMVFAISAKRRMTAIIGLGCVGFGVALLFSVYSAPDLAITQVLVETLTVVFFAWVVSRLPQMRQLSTSWQRVTDTLVAVATGVVVMLMVLEAKFIALGSPVSETLSQWSYAQAHGANTVNVILVDFRALDTFGEIIVLVVAAIGVWALLKTRADVHKNQWAKKQS